MIRIGEFVFPRVKTDLQVETVEVKSKTRKRALIESLLIDGGVESHRERIANLHAAVEAFDRQQAALSLHPGRHCKGRRQRFQLLPHPNGRITWARLALLAHDRYERSDELRQSQQELQGGECEFALIHVGNWPAQLRLEMLFGGDVNMVRVQTPQDEFILNAVMQSGQTLTVDSERCEASVGGVNLYLMSNRRFPRLPPGECVIRVSVEPAAPASCLIQYRDTWI